MTGELTIRDMVREIQKEARDTDLLPERSRVLLVRLTALMGNCNDEIRVADAAYASRLLGELDADGPANRAKIRAECSPEFARRQEARNTKELVVEMSRAIKVMIRSISEEMQLAR